ncbi:cupin domain-containing protein [Curtobacterium sp. ISL-83]|uniref:cupin domain-containing protein n=1 Tax=Curtobacterium sp. ISL-83 TaxID=2819145 RepID=UPI001BEA4B3A|nr:cupin domain-containing protein [Curtobacterium sp. ISL-83]MBT2503460.1 cupin domain-containing protein [Curtobacterium sp. ISL-83]
MTASPITRSTLLDQPLGGGMDVAHVEVRRISIAAGTTGGAHIHNGPVFGTIEKGSVTFQIGDGTATTLRAGDVFYEPAGVVVSKFDTSAEDVVFLGYFLLADGAPPEIEFTSQA